MSSQYSGEGACCNWEVRVPGSSVTIWDKVEKNNGTKYHSIESNKTKQNTNRIE